jgi:hypothetical protein
VTVIFAPFLGTFRPTVMPEAESGYNMTYEQERASFWPKIRNLHKFYRGASVLYRIKLEPLYAESLAHCTEKRVLFFARQATFDYFPSYLRIKFVPRLLEFIAYINIIELVIRDEIL